VEQSALSHGNEDAMTSIPNAVDQEYCPELLGMDQQESPSFPNPVFFDTT